MLKSFFKHDGVSVEYQTGAWISILDRKVSRTAMVVDKVGNYVKGMIDGFRRRIRARVAVSWPC